MASKTSHSGVVKKSITIISSQARVWKIIGNIVDMSWVTGVKKTSFLSEKKRGIGAIRKITLDDKSVIEEHIVLWESGSRFSYIATKGLPLHAYVATISLKQKGPDITQITWQSYLNSTDMSKVEFSKFLIQMGSFYEISLGNLKDMLESKPPRRK